MRSLRSGARAPFRSVARAVRALLGRAEGELSDVPRRDVSAFVIEALESRLLLSADISYAALTAPHDMTLRASFSAGTETMLLVNTATGASVASVSGAALPGSGVIHAAGGSLLDPGAADIIRVDLASFATLNGASSSFAAGSTFSITFVGDTNTAAPSRIYVDGGTATTASLSYGLSIASQSPITADGTATIAGDFSLSSIVSTSGAFNTGIAANAATEITLSGAHFSASGTVALSANAQLSVNDTGPGVVQGFTLTSPGAVITTDASAMVDITAGSVVTGGQVQIAALVDGHLSASVQNWPIKVISITGSATSSVTIDGGSVVTATGADTAASAHAPRQSALSVSAATDVTINAVAKPGVSGTVASATSGMPDAASVSTQYSHTSSLDITGGAVLRASAASGAGSVSLQAVDRLDATNEADASISQTGGASLALSLISGDTTAMVSGATIEAGGVTLEAETYRTITTSALSSPGGGDPNNIAQDPASAALGQYQASTSSGNISVAGAIAIGTEAGRTSAYLNNAVINAGTGAVAVTAAMADIVDISANGQTTSGSATGVGVAVAINDVVRSGKAYLTGTDVVTAGALDVTVVQAEGDASAFTATAESGAGAASDLNIAGAVALTTVITDHEAYLAPGATLTLHGAPAAAFGVTDEISIATSAAPDMAGAGGSLGLGASVAFTDGEDTTAAYVGDGATITGAGSVSLTADSTRSIDSEATGGGSGDVAFAPVVAISFSNGTTYATLGSGGQLNVSGDVVVSASLSNAVIAGAAGDTTAGKAGVGLSIALTIVNDSAQATTGRDIVSSAGAVSFLSSAISRSQALATASAGGGEEDDGGDDQSVDAETEKQKSFGDAQGDKGAKKADPSASTKGSAGDDASGAETSDGAVSVAGAVAVDVEKSSSKAFVPTARSITAAGALSVNSLSNVDGHAVASGVAATSGSGVGVGAAVSVNLATNTNLAYIETGATIQAGGLDVSAGMAQLPWAFTVETQQVVWSVPDTGAWAHQLNGAGHAYLTGTFDPEAYAEVDTLFLGADAGLSTGQAVIYSANHHSPISGLIDGFLYYVNVQSDGRTALYYTAAAAEAGGFSNQRVLMFGTPTDSTQGTDQFFYHSVGVTDVLSATSLDSLLRVHFNPTGTVKLLNLDPGALFSTGDTITYSVGAATDINGNPILDGQGNPVPGSPAIGGLTDGATYHLILVSSGTPAVAGGNPLYQIAASADDARSGTAIVLTGDGNPDQVLIDQTNSTLAGATSGGGGGKIGVAGSVAVNIVTNDVQAVVGRAATGVATPASITIVSAGDVTVSATNSAEAVAMALPDGEGAGGSSAGIGGSGAANVLTTRTIAQVSDGTLWSGQAGAFTMAADSSAYAMTEAQNGAAGGGVSVGIGVGVLITHDTTTAYLGTGGDITATGDVSVTATAAGAFVTQTSADAAGSSAAVGASVSVAMQFETTTVSVARGLSSDGTATGADGAIAVAATSGLTVSTTATASSSGDSGDDEEASSKNDTSKTGADGQADHAVNDNANTKGGDTAQSSAGSTTTSASGKSQEKGGGKSGGVGIAASVAYNTLHSTTATTVLSGADLIGAGAVSILSGSLIDATATAVGSAVAVGQSGGQKVSIGAAVSLNFIDATNKAAVASGSTISGDGVSIQAITPPDPDSGGAQSNSIVAWAASAGGNSGSAGIAGSVALIDVARFDTQASAAGGSVLVSTGDLTVEASNALSVQTLAAAGAFSKGASIGGSAAVAILPVSTMAFIAGNADAAGLLLVSASSVLTPSLVALPFLPAAQDPTATSIAVAGAAGTGAASVAGSVVINEFSFSAIAYIDSASRINRGGLVAASAGQSVTVSALNTTTVTALAGALGLTSGAAGVGASLDLELITKTTRASIGAGAIVSAGGSVTISAVSSETMTSLAATLAGGDSAGIAGTASIAIITTSTLGTLDAGGSVLAGGSVTIGASETFKSTMIVGSIGVSGSAGVGAANATLVRNDTTTALVAAGDTITAAGGGLSVAAHASEDILSIVAGVAVGGSAGVAGSAAVNLLTDRTTAAVAHGSRVTVSAGSLVVSAIDDTSVISVAGDLAAGGSAGIGVGVDVGTFDKRTNAFIGSGVTATVAGDVIVCAEAQETLISVAAGVAVGSVAVGINAGVHTFALQTRAFIGDDPSAATLSGAGNVHAAGSVVVSATDTTSINEIVGVLAAGSAGVAAGAGVTVANKEVKAFIGTGAIVTGDGNSTALTVARVQV